jgi:hypothetical protein
MLTATNATGSVGASWFQGSAHRTGVDLVIDEFLPFFSNPDKGQSLDLFQVAGLRTIHRPIYPLIGFRLTR